MIHGAMVHGGHLRLFRTGVAHGGVIHVHRAVIHPHIRHGT